MRPTKISSLPDSLRRKRHLARQPKKIPGTPEDIHRIVHELANQLTVINLNCFKLRGTVAKLLSGSSLDELESVDRAVAEMTNLLRTLHQGEEAPPPQTHNHAAAQPPPANVYQLFDSTQEG